MIPIRDKPSSGIFPFITILLIVICAYVLFKEFTAENVDEFLFKWALVPVKLQLSNPQSFTPLVTSIFLHGSLFHFLSNMLYLWIFGDNVEAELGKIGYLLFYIAGGVVANIAQLLFLQGGKVPILGASGAIAGVLGYYAVRFPHNRVSTLVILIIFITFIDLPALLVLGFWFVTQLLNGYSELAQSSAGSGIAFFAHIGGFIFGAAVALLLSPFINNRKGRNAENSYLGE